MTDKMKKIFIGCLLAAVFAGYGSFALAAKNSDTKGDLCGGTGGNGQVVSVGSNEFVITRNNDGKQQTIHLTNNATIETSAGFVNLSDLKTGDRITLVGGPNKDGSFTVYAIVVCAKTSNTTMQEKGGAEAAPFAVRNNDPSYNKVNGVINRAIWLPVFLLWLGISVFLRIKKKKSFVYLLFFTIFFVYLYKVIDYTLLQFQSLLLLKHFLPGLMLNGLSAGKSINIVPLFTLAAQDIKTSLLNILMMMPFGFGLPFISSFRMKKVVLAGFYLSIVIELLQFITGFLANTTFRVADINDIIFNTLGVAIGYVLFVVFIRICRRLFSSWNFPIMEYIKHRPQI